MKKAYYIVVGLLLCAAIAVVAVWRSERPEKPRVAIQPVPDSTVPETPSLGERLAQGGHAPPAPAAVAPAAPEAPPLPRVLSASELRALERRQQREDSGGLIPNIEVPNQARVHETIRLSAAGSVGSNLRYRWEIQLPNGETVAIPTNAPIVSYQIGVTGIVRGTLWISDEQNRKRPANFDITVSP